MVREVFADTSGWASAFVSTQRYHTSAGAFLRQWQANGMQVVTTSYVLAELIPLLTSPLRMPRTQQVQIVETIRAASWVEVIHVDEALDAEAFALLKQRLDKEWSLVDCASFVVMSRRGITEALTSDHHFEQAGFVCLLK